MSDGLLIANRGEIAVRVAETARALGYRTIAMYSSADRGAPHVEACDEAYFAGEAPAARSYLDAERVLEIARESGAWGIHPGYGFLSERPDFAERCEAQGLVFVGPSAAAMRALGDKARAKRALEPHGIPFVPGYHADDQSEGAFVEAARGIGVPLLVKAAAGGGGRGMRRVDDLAALPSALASARAEALAAFGDGTLLLERAIDRPRHIEVQIAADAHGNVVHLGERECSVQRRYQKIVEESPSTAVDAALREHLGETAIRIARATGYRGLGTIEFLLDERGEFYFIEANARLQVEHRITEVRYGVDLVEWQLRIARGEALPSLREPNGAAIEVRLCAEDASAGFAPQTGTIVAWQRPFEAGVTVDAALRDGSVVTEYYDSMLAKIIAYAPTRDDARRALIDALDGTILLGLETNAASLRAIVADDAFARGETTTAFLVERSMQLDASMAAQAPSRELAAALAACAAYRSSRERAGFAGPWAAWSSSEAPAATLRLRDERDGIERDVRIASMRDVEGETFHASIGTTAFAIALEDDHRARTSLRALRARIVDRDGRRSALRATFVESGDGRYLHVGASAFAFRDLAREPHAPAEAAGGDGVLRAPTGGRVLHVRASAGDRVAAKSVVVVLEAMKMEHAVAVPVDATITDVSAVVGASVARGGILARYQA